MLESEIHSGRDYYNKCNWRLHVDVLSRLSGQLEYEVRTGPLVGKGGKVSISEFAERVVAEALPQHFANSQ